MIKSVSNYQFYKFIENTFKSEKSQKNLILEPLCVIFRLSLLQYKDKGTKLSVKDNSIQYQSPEGQGMVRTLQGDCREDLHNLYHPILKSIDWYPYSDYKTLYDESLIGLRLLNDVYGGNSTIKHTISHYISVIELNDIENFREDAEFNPIIDTLKEIWTEPEIKSACAILQLIKIYQNRDIYINELEVILDSKEKFINEYIHKISTTY